MSRQAKKHSPSPAPSSVQIPIADSPRGTLLGFAGILLIAVAVRAIYLAQLQGTLPFSTLVVDGRAYDAWGQKIAAGDWLGSEVFYQAPLYPYGLGLLYSVFGRNLLLVRILQAGLSVAACLLLAWTGRRFFSPRAGLIAGLMLAVYPPAVFFDGLIQKASLDLWLMTLLLALVAEATQRRTWPWLLAAGAALGALTLNRENARILYPVFAAWIWFYFGTVPVRQRAGWIAAFTAGMALFLLPVGLRNYWVGGEFALSTSQVGPNFYIGNHAGATGRYEPLVPRRGDPQFERADATRLAEQAKGHKLSPGEVSRYWLQRSFDDIEQQPLDWLRLLGWKFLLLFHGTEMADSEAIEVYANYSWLLRVMSPLWHFGIVMPLAVLGVWSTRRHWRELWVLYAIFGALATSTAAFYVFGRYRFLLVPVALLFAAAALAELPQLCSNGENRRNWRSWLPGLLLAAATAIFCNYPLPSFRDDAITYWNLGSGLLLDCRPAEALEPLERAIAIQPDLAGAHHNLGLALTALKRRDEGAKEEEIAIQYAADFGDAHASLGQYYADSKQPEKAINHLRRAADLVAEPALLRVELGQLLHQRGDVAGAVAQYRAALEAKPDLPIALNSLVWVLATDPDPEIRNGSEAVQLADRMLAAINKPPRPLPVQEAALLDTVAAAYAEAGRYDDALTFLRRAIELAKPAKNPRFNEILAARAALFENRQPYREPANSHVEFSP